jgi:hypothetical protein
MQVLKFTWMIATKGQNELRNSSGNFTIDRDPPRLIFAERVCYRLLKFHLRHDSRFLV